MIDPASYLLDTAVCTLGVFLGRLSGSRERRRLRAECDDMRGMTHQLLTAVASLHRDIDRSANAAAAATHEVVAVTQRLTAATAHMLPPVTMPDRRPCTRRAP